MKIHAAFTAPVNPPGASPLLSRAQMWKGHEYKAEYPQPFVPVSACEVLERRADGLTRRITFKEGAPGPPGSKATEDIIFFGNVKADFNMRERDTRVSNIISRGPGGEHDLYLTYTFAIDFPDIVEGTPEAAAKLAEIEGMSSKVVPHVVLTIRNLVVEGKI